MTALAEHYLRSLLIGPLFVVAVFAFALGCRSELKEAVERKDS